MKKPKRPENEAQRLENLQDYFILDTPEESEFDELTKLAAKICGVPIALVSLIDEDRQWFKSHYGLDARETPRDVSFCGHAINQNSLFEVNNAFKDSRFLDNPLVTGDPNVIFYAGQPLKSSEGFNLGTLCVIDHSPRELSEDQKESLRIIANQVIAQLSLRKQNISLKQSFNKLKKTSAELESRNIQLIEAEKMVALGQLAGGVAHEINNPLAIISLLAAQIKVGFENKSLDEEKIFQLIDKIEATVQRIKKIIEGLRNISRDARNDSMENASLESIIENATVICKEKFKENGVQFNIEGNLDIEICCRSGEISQILINLLTNAFDAISESTGKKWISIHVESSNNKVNISVIDSGEGIDSSLANQIMSPFFTTKKKEKGTGLGLSISKAIAQNHSGDLILDLKAPQTKFTLSLPLD